MIRRFILTSLCVTFAAIALSFLTSCAVNENAALETGAAATGSKTKKTEIETGSDQLSRSEKMKADQEARNAAKAKAADEKAKVAAAKAKEDEIAAKKLAATKKSEEAAKAKAAERKLAEEKKAAAAEKSGELVSSEKVAKEKAAKEKAVKEAAETKAREEALAAKDKEREAAKLAKMEARKKADQEVSAETSPSGGDGGFFSLFSGGPSVSQYKSKGHDVYVNRMLLPTLNPANAKIEISLGEQRARIYRNDGADKVLIIETQISSGKSGHGTSTGTFRINEKLVEKRSTLYGSWVSSDGQTVGGSNQSSSRPSGGSRFVGAEMPYWMRFNGGMGMHVGYVPDYPASHGCVRVPAAVQPLIFSKVGVGTSVTITH